MFKPNSTEQNVLCIMKHNREIYSYYEVKKPVNELF